MSIDLTSNHFELFEQPVGFAVDTSALTARYHELQSLLHPDRFATASAAERRWSVQAVSVVNDAYQTLGDPLRRAIYLLELNGISVDKETDTAMDPMFLMQQMELREALEAAESASDPYAAIDKLRAEIRAGADEQRDTFMTAADNEDWDAARTAVRQWQFLDRIAASASQLEARLDDEA